MNEPLAADTWIYNTLRNDPTLASLLIRSGKTHIYIDQPPQEKVGDPLLFPYILFQMESAVDLNIVGPRRFWTNMLYLVRGIAESGSYGGSLATIAERIDEVLHATPNGESNAYGIVWAAYSEEVRRYPEVANGRNFRHLGRRFRVYASKEV
jgi:hypothetical protein